MVHKTESEDSVSSDSEEVQNSSLDFSADDIESLQNAHIDNLLLETHFLGSDQNEDAVREELEYQAKIFGYTKLTKLQLYKKRLEYL